MATVRATSTQQFDAQWSKARADGSEQGYRVSYGEVKAALGVLKEKGLSRKEALHAASTFSQDPVLTRPAAKEALAFLALVGKGKPLDAATIEAIKADFSIRAAKPFSSLAVPGREVKNTADLPEKVHQALADTREPDADANWESVVARKVTLAGQPVYVVHFSALDDGNGDAEKVRVFSANGQLLAKGSLFDGMAGFSWD